MDYNYSKTGFKGVHGDWELINEDSGKRTNSRRILAEYKCRKCENSLFAQKYEMGRAIFVCKKCTENYYKDIFIGQTYNRLTIRSYAYTKNERHYYYCSCSCNNEIMDRPLQLEHLKSGNTKSCGCLHPEKVITHGMTNTRIYSIYGNMKCRCYNINDKGYIRYGGRGIYICDEWMGENGFVNFYNWSIQNGYNDDLSIDRIDNDGPYAPWNCRWATPIEQANNTSKNHHVDIAGVNYTMAEICRKYNINRSTLEHQIKTKNIEQIIYEQYNLRIPIRFVQPDTPLKSPIRFV